MEEDIREKRNQDASSVDADDIEEQLIIARQILNRLRQNKTDFYKRTASLREEKEFNKIKEDIG